MRYQCLVLDHDDTVVASEATVNYPCFVQVLNRFRPGEFMELDDFTRWCFDYGFSEFLRLKYGFTDQELEEEFQLWLDYARTRIPPAYPGIRELVLEQKRRGGYVCVVSHSGRYNILRDYQTHFDMEPDLIFSWEDPQEQRKPNPYPLAQIMERFHLPAEQLLMIDDLKPGFDMARAAGVPFAYAGWGRTNVPEITRFMHQYCDYAFDSVRALYDFQFQPLSRDKNTPLTAMI